MLALLLTIAMVLPFCPVRAEAAEDAPPVTAPDDHGLTPPDTAPQIGDYETFLSNLKALEDYAAAYAGEHPASDPAWLVANFIRAGEERFSGAAWTQLAGAEDTAFSAYVREQEEAYNASASDKRNVMGLRNLVPFAVTGGETMDMAKLFALVAAGLHTDAADREAVAGWASDLADLMARADSKGITGTVEEMAQTIRTELLQKDAAFSRTDYLADLDGVRILDQVKAGGSIHDTLKSFYAASPTEEARAAYFLAQRMGGVSSRGDIRDRIFAAYTGNALAAAWESSHSFAAEDLSDLRRACCYAFADQLCQLAGDYVEMNDGRYVSVVSSQKTTLTEGITQEIFKGTTTDGKQVVYYVATADIASPYVDVYANYKDNDPSKGWGMQKVRDQVKAANARHSDPASPNYIPYYQVVASINGAGYNMTTGEPGGLLVMGGVEYQAPDGNGFFGILSDGTARIGSTEEYNSLKAQGKVMEGIAIFGTTLVKDGQIAVVPYAGHVNDRASRTAVGITRTGKVVFMVVDGRQEPVSCGASMLEIAQIMLDAGCVDAVNLDGGGSTTYMALQPGDSEISLVNNPSDGFERSVSTSLIMVSTLPGADALDHAQLSTEVDYLTIGSSVAVTARGVNAAGQDAQLPSKLTWTVSDSSVASVTTSGIVTGLKNGTVEVRLMQGTKVLGTKTLQVVVPDGVYFTQSPIQAAWGEITELPVTATYQGKPMAFRAEDIAFTLSNPSAGTLRGLTFTAAVDPSIRNVTITAAAAKDPAVSGSAEIVLFGRNEASFDFSRVTGGDRELAWVRKVTNATTDDGFTYLVHKAGEPMAAQYTLALDLSRLPLDSGALAAACSQLGVTTGSQGALLALADKLSTATVLMPTITFDEDLTVDVSNIAVTGSLVTLVDAKVDSATNTLVITLGWKSQSAPLSLESTNGVCVITGITAAPRSGAAWDSGNRLALANTVGMDFAVCLKGDALHTWAAANPDKGVEAYEVSGEKGGRILGGGTAGEDSFTLINSVKNGWFHEDGGYAFYENGSRYTGVRRAGDFYYDFGESGINQGQVKYSGLFMEKGKRCYAKDGVLTPGWYIEGDDHYYFDENGVGYHGKVKIDEVEIEFDNGLQIGGHTGFVTKTNGYTYHYTNGIMDYGWVYVGDDLYHFNTNIGTMTTGTHVIPDEEASAKGAYYDFAPDGRTLRGYFNGFGYYYWAGKPASNKWVKSGADPDPEAWYRTNTNGHFVTDATGKETFSLTMGGKTYKAVKIECDGVVYTFDTTNGKLLRGDFVLKDGAWYYYWAGAPVNDGWFDLEGKKYYAYEDGHLALGSNTIDGETYMFSGRGELITEKPILTAALTSGGSKLTIRLEDDTAHKALWVAVWGEKAGQAASLQWIQLDAVSGGVWSKEIHACSLGISGADLLNLHAYSGELKETFLISTTMNMAGPADHSYGHDFDYKCDLCGETREVDMTRPMVDMFRMYNPNTGEHFYTGSEVERDNLIGHGWQYEGVGFTFPLTTGDPVHRLFQPSTGEHLYTMDVNEKDALLAAGWNYEGIAFNSGFENEVPQYRLHNPNATVGAYHFTASAEERDNLLNAGWEYQGIGWYSLGSMS